MAAYDPHMPLPPSYEGPNKPRLAALGLQDDKKKDCTCLQKIKLTTQYVDDVMELAHALVQIMIICGIHECKARNALDVVTYYLLHFETVRYCGESKSKKIIRKEDLLDNFNQKCLMNRVETMLCYHIVKYGFKAFYYVHKAPPKNKKCLPKVPNPPDYYDEECTYLNAALRTANYFASVNPRVINPLEYGCYEKRIKVAYKKFYDAMVQRRKQPADDTCGCCMCEKKRAAKRAAEAKPAAAPAAPKRIVRTKRCRSPCKVKRVQQRNKTVEEARCANCCCTLSQCTCPKYDFSLNFVKSIWDRCDFDLYNYVTFQRPTDLAAAPKGPCPRSRPRSREPLFWGQRNKPKEFEEGVTPCGTELNTIKGDYALWRSTKRKSTVGKNCVF